jgi:hypothetical protein
VRLSHRLRVRTHRDEEGADVLALVALQLNHMPLRSESTKARARVRKQTQTLFRQCKCVHKNDWRAAVPPRACSGSSTTVPLQQNSFLKALSTFL